MRDGWYFHDIKVKFILFVYKIQYIFLCRFSHFCVTDLSLLGHSQLLSSMFLYSHFKGSSLSSLFTFMAQLLKCVLCIAYHHWFILQELKSGVSAIFPVMSILSNTWDTPLTPYWNSQQNLTELVTLYFFEHCLIMVSIAPGISGFLSLLLIKISLLHYLNYYNSSRFFPGLSYLFLWILIILVFFCSLWDIDIRTNISSYVFINWLINYFISSSQR